MARDSYGSHVLIRGSGLYPPTPIRATILALLREDQDRGRQHLGLRCCEGGRREARYPCIPVVHAWATPLRRPFLFFAPLKKLLDAASEVNDNSRAGEEEASSWIEAKLSPPALGGAFCLGRGITAWRATHAG